VDVVARKREVLDAGIGRRPVAQGADGVYQERRAVLDAVVGLDD